MIFALIRRLFAPGLCQSLRNCNCCQYWEMSLWQCALNHIKNYSSQEGDICFTQSRDCFAPLCQSGCHLKDRCNLWYSDQWYGLFNPDSWVYILRIWGFFCHRYLKAISSKPNSLQQEGWGKLCLLTSLSERILNYIWGALIFDVEYSEFLPPVHISFP